MAVFDMGLDERLRELARSSAERMDTDRGRAEMAIGARVARAGAIVDPSPEALDARLRRMSAISALCVELARGQTRR